MLYGLKTVTEAATTQGGGERAKNEDIERATSYSPLIVTLAAGGFVCELLLSHYWIMGRYTQMLTQEQIAHSPPSGYTRYYMKFMHYA